MLQAWLFFLHAEMDAVMDSARAFVVDRDGFYTLHRAYLISSTIQWAAGLAWIGLTIRAWRGSPSIQ